MSGEVVFIAWSNLELAIEVKKILDKMGYHAIVGGDYSGNETRFIINENIVFSTIKKQLDFCTCAIALLQPKGINDNKIGQNLHFELGYLLSKFSAYGQNRRLITFKINKNNENVELGSDVDGIWSYKIGLTDNLESMAKEIVDKFIVEKAKITKSKFEMMNQHSFIEEEILNYHVAPRISDYELSIWLLMYNHGKYLMQKTSESNHFMGILKTKLNDYTNYCLKNTVALIETSLKVFNLSMPNDDGIVDVSFKVVRRVMNDFKKIFLNIYHDTYNVSYDFNEYSELNVQFTDEDLEKDELKVWSCSLIQQYISYLLLLFFDNKKNYEQNPKLLISAINIGKTTISNFKLLEKDQKNFIVAQLFDSYQNKNLSAFYGILNEEKNIKVYEMGSFEARKALYDEINENKGDVQPLIYEQICLEYFFQLAESLCGMDVNNIRFEDYYDDLNQFIDAFEQKERIRTTVWERIKSIKQTVDKKAQSIL